MLFDDQLKQQLRHLLQSPQWKAFEALKREVEEEIKNERATGVAYTADQMLYRSIAKEAKIDGMNLLINTAKKRATKAE